MGTCNDEKVQYSRSLQQFALDTVAFLFFAVEDEGSQDLKDEVTLHQCIPTMKRKSRDTPHASTALFTLPTEPPVGTAYSSLYIYSN